MAIERIVCLPSESDIEKLVSSVCKSTARENFDNVRRRTVRNLELDRCNEVRIVRRFAENLPLSRRIRK